MISAAETCRPSAPCGRCDDCADGGKPFLTGGEFLDADLSHLPEQPAGLVSAERTARDMGYVASTPVPQLTPYQLEQQRKAQAQQQARASAVQDFESSLLSSDDISELPPPSWLIDSYLTTDSLAMLYGPSGSCKTFLAICWARHVETGLWWHGHETKQGRVMYVIAEGARGVGRRLEAWKEHHAERIATARAYDVNDDIAWRPRAVNLTDPLEVEALIACASIRYPELVVFDTLARCTLGAEENSAKDMGAVVAALDRIRDETGACVLCVHHTGKEATNGARGSSALRAAMDTELEITAVDHRLVLKVTKQKDDEEARPLRLNRVPVAGSCVLVPGGDAAVTDDLGPSVEATLDALRLAQVPGGVSATAWQDTADCSRRSFFNHRGQLVRLGLVMNVGTDRQPRYLVREDAEKEATKADDMLDF